MNRFQLKQQLRKYDGWKLPIVSGIALLLALMSALSKPGEKQRVPLVTPATSPYASTVAGIGVVEPKSETISIGVELPGVVRTMHVEVGDTVEKGDPLFSLDARDIDAQIETLVATLAAANVKAQDAAAQFAIVENMADQRAISKDDYNRRKFAEELAMANVREIEAQLAQARTTKDRLTVKAPISGQILEVNTRPGEFASAGDLPTPLMRLGDVSTLHVRVEIDEENAARVHKDAPAKAFRRGDTQAAIPLTFVRFEPFVKPKQNLANSGQRVDTRVLQVLYAVEKTDAPILIGQQMDVFIDREAVKVAPSEDEDQTSEEADEAKETPPDDEKKDR